MDTSNLVALFAYLLTISAIAERVTEQAKSLFKVDSIKSHTKTAFFVFHCVGISAGAVCSFFISYKDLVVLKDISNPYAAAVIIGFLTASGSGVWHDLIGVINKAKNSIKTAS